jgi:hypothetical protein
VNGISNCGFPNFSKGDNGNDYTITASHFNASGGLQERI